MSQPKRLGALTKFKSRQRDILIATDVASRGLDIPAVDVVVNFDIPGHGKDYVHRVGRTARAGRAGRSVAFVTQYDVEVYQRMEALIGRKLAAYPCEEEAVLVLLERVSEAQRMAARELREADTGKKGSGKRKFADDDEGGDVDAAVKKFSGGRGSGGSSSSGRGGSSGGRGRGSSRGGSRGRGGGGRGRR
jgi:ATP-dependent RNA helicase DDX47/RRP3